MMFPTFLAIVPLFFVVKGFGMISTYQGLIFVYLLFYRQVQSGLTGATLK